jgi:hypothetical protein
VLQSDPFPYLAGFKSTGSPELTNATGGGSGLRRRYSLPLGRRPSSRRSTVGRGAARSRRRRRLLLIRGIRVVVRVRVCSVPPGLETVCDHPQQRSARSGEGFVQTLRDITAVILDLFKYLVVWTDQIQPYKDVYCSTWMTS